VPIGSLLRFFNGTSQVGFFFSRSTTNKQSIATQLHEPNYAEGKQSAIVTVVYDYTKYTFYFYFAANYLAKTLPIATVISRLRANGSGWQEEEHDEVW